jgi:hypothetical protein
MAYDPTNPRETSPVTGGSTRPSQSYKKSPPTYLEKLASGEIRKAPIIGMPQTGSWTAGRRNSPGGYNAPKSGGHPWFFPGAINPPLPERGYAYSAKVQIPTEENPYGVGLGYDPVNPRSTARSEGWINKHTEGGGGFKGLFMGRLLKGWNPDTRYLKQSGVNQLYKQNPNYNLPQVQIPSSGVWGRMW